MATTGLGYEALTALCARLLAGADVVVNPARQDIADDLRTAAVVASRMASLQLRIGEIAEQALTQDPGATARDLREALADAASGEG